MRVKMIYLFTNLIKKLLIQPRKGEKVQGIIFQKMTNVVNLFEIEFMIMYLIFNYFL